ncbi:radical SAM protein, partial [Candidatus Woesearchaeota archaeon]|nr:radical SAM protein [Candidatus Woesearchaeota archaeon]
ARKCRVNRVKEEVGYCRVGKKPRIFGAHPHLGEEQILVPSATIFFAGCTMRCVYCQNAPESLTPEHGRIWSEEEIARWIEKMEQNGCRNVNFVGGEPTPYLWNILKALNLTNAKLPVVWNSNAYYSEQTAELLKGLVDIYLLDFRYFNPKCAIELSDAPNYPDVAKRNILAATKDSFLMVRLLVLPGHIECCAKPILRWLRKNIKRHFYLNIMDQYWPAYKASGYAKINRHLSPDEFREVTEFAKELGL